MEDLFAWSLIHFLHVWLSLFKFGFGFTSCVPIHQNIFYHKDIEFMKLDHVFSHISLFWANRFAFRHYNNRWTVKQPLAPINSVSMRLSYFLQTFSIGFETIFWTFSKSYKIPKLFDYISLSFLSYTSLCWEVSGRSRESLCQLMKTR